MKKNAVRPAVRKHARPLPDPGIIPRTPRTALRSRRRDRPSWNQALRHQIDSEIHSFEAVRAEKSLIAWLRKDECGGTRFTCGVDESVAGAALDDAAVRRDESHHLHEGVEISCVVAPSS